MVGIVKTDTAKIGASETIGVSATRAVLPVLGMLAVWVCARASSSFRQIWH